MDVLVIDAGGSGVRGVRQAGELPATQASGPGVRIVGGRVDLDDLVQRCTPLLSATPPDVTCWGVRGLLTLIDADDLLQRVARHTRARRVILASDAVTAAAGALGKVQTGVVTAIGSGIVTFATDFDTQWHRIDGWGQVLGDRGSGAWIGRAGLAAALAAVDGVPSGSPTLLEAGHAQFGPHLTWPSRVMGVADATAVLAGFAPAVDVAAAHCVQARQILVEGAGHVLDALEAGARRLPGAPLVLTGGALRMGAYAALIEAGALDRGLEVRRAVAGSIDGAMLLARHAGAGGQIRNARPFLLTRQGW